MSRRPNLTAAQRDEIAYLREEHGWTIVRIARKIGCSEGSVGWALLAMGVDKPGRVYRPPQPLLVPVSCLRNGHLVARYTYHDDAQLLALEAQGLNPLQIGKRLEPSRQPNSVLGRLRTLARHAARFEAGEAHAAETHVVETQPDVRAA